MSARPSLDLDAQLSALEPLRRATGLSRVLRLALIAGFVFVGLVTGVVAMFLIPEAVYPIPPDIEPGTPVPVSDAESRLMTISFFVPFAVGLALALLTWLRLRRSGSPAVHRARFAAEVRLPLAHEALPGATVHAPAPLPAALIARSAAFPEPVHSTLSEARLTATYDVPCDNGSVVPMELVAGRFVAQEQRYSERRASFYHPELFDGLLVWFARPGLVPALLVAGDARLYPRVRELAHEPVPMRDARFVELPTHVDVLADVLRQGPTQWSGLQGLMLAAQEPSLVAKAYSSALGDAIVDIASHVKVPFLLVFTPAGVALRLDGAGRMRALDATDELDERVGNVDATTAVLRMAAALRDDTRLLAAMPEIARVLQRTRALLTT